MRIDDAFQALVELAASRHNAFHASEAADIRAATLETAGAASCHRGSGWLHGWFENPPAVADIWVPGHGRRTDPSVRQHRASAIDVDRDVTEVNGICTLNAAATLCLLGRVEPDEVVESHGRRFHWGRRAEEADNERDLTLAAAGWQLLYVTWNQLQDPACLRTRVVDAAEARVKRQRSA